MVKRLEFMMRCDLKDGTAGNNQDLHNYSVMGCVKES